MTDFEVALPDGRTVSVQANSPEEAAQGARNYLARERGAASGTNQTEAAGHAFAQGGTFGFADELAAAVRSVLPDFMKRGAALQRDESIGGNAPQPQFSNAPTVGQRYDEELANIRGRQAAEQKNFPTTTTAANIAGNVGAAAIALPAAATSVGPSLVGNIVKGGLTGTVLGGAQGFGEGEGGFTDRAVHAAPGALYGGVGGTAVPIVGKAGSIAADTPWGRAVQENVIAPALTWAGEKLGGKVPMRTLSAAAPDSGPVPEGFGQSLVNAGQSMAQPARRGAVNDFADVIQKSNTSPEQIAAELERMGPEGLFVDVNRQLMGKGRGLTVLPGQTQDLAKSVLEARVAGRPGRMISAFEGGESPPPTHTLLRGFDENASAVGNEAYGAMREAGFKTNDAMWDIMRNRPIIRSAIEKIQADAAYAGEKLDPITMVDRVKQYINKVANSAMTDGGPVNKIDLARVADEFEQAYWKANPLAKEAAAKYAAAKSLPEYFDKGRNFLAGGTGEKGIDATSAALADALAGANVQQATAARVGSTSSARDLMSGMGAQSQANRIIKGIDQGSDVQARLGELYGSEHAGSIVRRSALERRFQDTERKLLNQSDTANKAMEAADVGNASLRLSTSGGIKGFASEKLASMLAALGDSQAVRDEYGRLLFARNPETRADILKLADQLLRQRAAGTAASTASGAALGEQLAR